MSQARVQAAAVDLPQAPDRQPSFLLTSLQYYAALGALSFFVLAAAEFLDVIFRFSNLFESVSEKAVFSSYFSINLLIGALVGVLVGLSCKISSLLCRGMGRIGAAFRLPPALRWAAAYLTAAAIGAVILNQLRPINLYGLGLIREAEKFSFLRERLLNHERASGYLLVMALLIGCSAIWLIARNSAGLRKSLRVLLMSGLGSLAFAAYYVDSRISLQLYEYTMHRSCYLLTVVATIGLVAAGPLPEDPGVSLRFVPSTIRKGLTLAIALLFVACLAFTLVHFDSHQNLKTLVFFRTTQMKQNFRLARWALDFDRDGYSALLGGGDTNDRQASVNPGQLETAEDGVDNNSIGGDLTRPSIDEWKAEHEAVRPTALHTSSRYNVVYFFIDALRADHLGTYGYERSTTPNIDKLGTRGTVFENAFTPSPRTSEAVPKFMQSSYWDAHVDAWTQVLTRNGYNTMLFPGRRSWERYKQWMPVVPKAQGRPLKDNIDSAIDTLEKTPSDRPFCAFIYVPDPHRPYLRHEEFTYGDTVTDLYDGEVAYTDFHIGRFLDWMESSGKLNNTIVVIMSDHGESLGERGVYLHATQLYNEQTRVPVVFYVPNNAARRVPDYITTVDLGSTILDAVGISYPKEYAGVSLMQLIRGEPFEHPPLYGEQTSQELSPFVRLDQQVHPDGKKYMVITQDGFKLIYNRDFFTFELFNLKADPGEERNLYNQLPVEANRMRRLLDRWVDVATALRPWDADEGRYGRLGGIDGDKVEE